MSMPITSSKHRRSREGCLTCRKRKKRCDLRRPTCLGCERNVLLCGWPAKSKPEQQPDSKEESVHCVQSSRTWNSPTFSISFSALGTQLRDTELLLLQHWLEKTSYVMSTQRGSANAFMAVLPRIALQYPDTVLQGLIALSGAHYLNSQENSEISTATWTHLGLALRALKHGLTMHSPQTTIPLLATTLVLCFIETIRGERTAYVLPHLRAARLLFKGIITAPSPIPVEDDVLDFLQDFYTYVEGITCMSGDISDPLRHPHKSLRTQAPSDLLCCSQELFSLVPEVHQLLHDHNNAVQDDVSAEDLKARYDDLWSRLDSWRPPTDINTDFAICGTLYQQAMLCNLETGFDTAAAQSQVVERASEAIDLLHSLPIESPTSPILLWPLVVFGIIVSLESKRAYLYYRLACMWENLRLANIKKAMLFLKKLWEEREASEELTLDRTYQTGTDIGAAMKRLDMEVSLV